MVTKTEKQCPTCKRFLPRTKEYFDFYKHQKNGKYYPSGKCKDCRRIQRKIYYQNNKTEANKSHDSWAYKNPEKLKQYRKISANNLKNDPVRLKKRIDYVNEWKEVNRDKIKKQHIKNNRILKLDILQHYASDGIPKCECCGEINPEFLTIDHINGGGYKHKKLIGGAGRTFYKWLIENNYPVGYRILCWNCNSSYGIYGGCPHNPDYQSTFHPC